jgi:precorrin-6Y C5,15-methyltransferase (decarboxylating)
MLAHPRNRAWAIEAQAERAGRILLNAAALGVPDLMVKLGRAPAALAGLPPPDAIFVGGGGSDVIDAAWEHLPSGRRLLVNAVTLETQAAVTERQTKLGGSLTGITISHAGPIGRYRGWKQARPVVQWLAVKP